MLNSVTGLSRFVLVRQSFPDRSVPDIPAAVRRELRESGISSQLAPGSRIAIGVGSRGISNLAVIVKAAVDFLHEQGHRPFLFPAMGSHGAATPEGQASVLDHYGISEGTMGCPVISSFDVVDLGRTALGIETYADRVAWSSDGILLINRVKWHTSFAGPLESGVCKMMAIGLGKIEGAQTSHSHARAHGMSAVIRSIGTHVLAQGKVLGGLGILEDAHHNTARIAALPAATLIAGEEELLRETKSWMGRIPVPHLDVLIVDEMGKNISGTGMDLKVVNRGAFGQYNPWPDTPVIERIFARSLTDLSYGNSVGIGLADVAHDRLIDRIDPQAGYINARTSGSLAAVRIPIHYPSDRECLDLVVNTVGKLDPSTVTIGWIRNTLELDLIALTENAIGGRELDVVSDPFEIHFDKAGQMEDLPVLQAAGVS